MTTPLRASRCLLGGCLGLWLAGAGCGVVSRPVLVAGPEPVREAIIPPSPKASPPPTLATVMQVLLDTVAGGSQATNARLSLQARAEVRAFYGPTPAPVWTVPGDSLNASAQAALALLTRAPEYGLRPADYGLSRLLALRDSLALAPASVVTQVAVVQQQARLEICLSDAVLAFMCDLRRGRMRTQFPNAREKAAGPASQPAAVLRAALANGRVSQAMLAGQPANREYRQLQVALARWLARLGSSDSVARHQARFEQLALNLERWRAEPIPEDEYLLINLPACELQVVVCDSVLRRFRVIVGKPETPTPTLNSRIKFFTLAPQWTVPHSIATLEMLPRLKDDPGYLADNNLELYDGRNRLRNPWRIDWEPVTTQSFAYTIRQSSCCDNALGNIVFRFPNPYSIYLHDTHQRQLFARPVRALSHGCIRLEHPRELAAFLLRREGHRDPLPTPAEAREAGPQDVHFSRPMPLYIRYATSVVEKGRLRFLSDIYGRDEVLRQELFGALP